MDLKKPEDLDKVEKDLLENFIKEHELEVVHLSNMEQDPIFEVKRAACDLLLKFRLEKEDKNVKKNSSIRREEDFLRGVTVFKPTKKRDEKARPAMPAPAKKPLGRATIKELE